MASNQLSCHFSLLRSDIFPPRYGICEGGVEKLVALEDCQELDKDGYMESYLILLRSGYLFEHNDSYHWYVCPGHRKKFGFDFVRSFMQKRCFYPEHSGKASPSKIVSQP